MTSIVGVLLYLTFGFVDTVVLADLDGLQWKLRGALVPAFALLIAGSWWTAKPWLREVLAAAGTLLMSLASTWLIGQSRALTATSHLAVLSLVPMFAGVITRMPFRNLLVVSIGTMLGAVGFVHGDGVTQTLILRGSVITVGAATIFALIAGYGLDYRERSRYLLGLLEIHQRQAILSRNRDMRLVLDNVDQALLTIDAAGFLAAERSKMAESWFGPSRVPMRFVQYIAATDPSFAANFDLAYDALLEDVLPQDLCLAQLPTTLRDGRRQFRCAYQPLAEENGRFAGLLLIARDVTDQLRHVEEQADQNELAAILRNIMRDRAGLLMFLKEGAELVRQLAAGCADPVAQQRLLHTLKGNAAVFGVETVASLCHRAEEQITIGESPVEYIRSIAARWEFTSETIRTLVETEHHGVGDISVQDVDALTDRIKSGAAIEDVLAELARWKFEPIERGLNRLAHHAVLLARRLGKADLKIEVSAPLLRLDPAVWDPICSVLIHVVRNAVDHGIEAPAERIAAGKEASGRFAARAALDDGTLLIEITDDGRGIDWARVEELAVQRRMPVAKRADLVRALLSPGFSTRAEATAISGRGVGLTAVDHQVRRVGGAIDVVSEPGLGTTWRFSFASLIKHSR